MHDKDAMAVFFCALWEFNEKSFPKSSKATSAQSTGQKLLLTQFAYKYFIQPNEDPWHHKMTLKKDLNNGLPITPEQVQELNIFLYKCGIAQNIQVPNLKNCFELKPGKCNGTFG
ncbi:MAG: hypothetical protein GY786_04350, partial [Proteobacteria bacterium]|nr:hypothetical protein [Pseudomonadota bacterium]